MAGEQISGISSFEILFLVKKKIGAVKQVWQNKKALTHVNSKSMDNYYKPQNVFWCACIFVILI